MVDIFKDPRIVLTMDAGGTNLVFGAMAKGQPVVDAITLPTHGDNLDLCLQTIIQGFDTVLKNLSGQPVAISFAFPGPADYPAGIIGDLGNFPAFKGGVPLGPMLQDHFKIPVFINNDGDLFVYGEAMAGLLPRVNRALETAGAARVYRNLFGVTLGTGFGAGLTQSSRMYQGDNSAGMEVWSTQSQAMPGHIAEETVSARAMSLSYAEKLNLAPADAPTPRQIFDILEGNGKGDRDVAAQVFRQYALALGEALANVACLTDSLMVLGGGLSLGHTHYLSRAVEHMKGALKTRGTSRVSRMEVTAFNWEDPLAREEFLQEKSLTIVVPGSGRKITYRPEKKIAVGVSVLGTSQAVALGAYAVALNAG